MKRCFFSYLTLAILIGHLQFNHSINAMNEVNLPLDMWSIIVYWCDAKTSNTVKKVCKVAYTAILKKYTNLPYGPSTTRYVPESISLERRIKYLLEHCAHGEPFATSQYCSKDIPFEKYEEAIRIALEKGYFECMRTVLLATPGTSPKFLQDAVIYSNSEAVEFLLGHYAPNPNQSIIGISAGLVRYETLLHRALHNKDTGIILQLINARINKNGVDYKKRTPLQLAQELLAQEPAEIRKFSEFQKIIPLLSATQN